MICERPCRLRTIDTVLSVEATTVKSLIEAHQNSTVNQTCNWSCLHPMNMQYEILHMVSSVASDGLEPTWLQAIWSCWIDIFVQHFIRDFTVCGQKARSCSQLMYWDGMCGIKGNYVAHWTWVLWGDQCMLDEAWQYSAWPSMIKLLLGNHGNKLCHYWVWGN